MSGPDFSLKRHGIHRRGYQKRPARSRAAARADRWLAPVVAAASVAALATFHGPSRDDPAAMPFPDAVAVADTLSARFGFCHIGGGRNCVVDGDTFRFAGETYRIADIDTPETHPARCADEAALGAAATGRLQAWLNAGAFSLESADRDTDRYGRKLRIVTRRGASVGEALVAEGMARRWEGHRRPWC